MKRVINGVTYNTDTATLIASASEDWDYDQRTGEAAGSRTLRLYQTRGGAFFLVTQTETQRENSEGEWRDITRVEFDAMTNSEARHWATGSSGLAIELVNHVFGEPPEAEAEEVPGATLYIRVPASLKDQIEAAAEEDRLSINAFMLRCAENCLTSRRARIGGKMGGLCDQLTAGWVMRTPTLREEFKADRHISENLRQLARSEGYIVERANKAKPGDVKFRFRRPGPDETAGELVDVIGED